MDILVIVKSYEPVEILFQKDKSKNLQDTIPIDDNIKNTSDRLNAYTQSLSKPNQVLLNSYPKMIKFQK